MRESSLWPDELTYCVLIIQPILWTSAAIYKLMESCLVTFFNLHVSLFTKGKKRPFRKQIPTPPLSWETEFMEGSYWSNFFRRLNLFQTKSLSAKKRMDVVVKADPKSPPKSLPFICSLLQKSGWVDASLMLWSSAWNILSSCLVLAWHDCVEWKFILCHTTYFSCEI